jgi:cbb3-type cytochrome oxidase subunit 1
MIYVALGFVYLTGMVAFWFLVDNTITNVRLRSPVRATLAFLLWPLVIIAMAVGPLFMKD